MLKLLIGDVNKGKYLYIGTVTEMNAVDKTTIPQYSECIVTSAGKVTDRYTFDGTTWNCNEGSANNPLSTTVKSLSVAKEITRVAGGDTTAYTIGDILNDPAALSLPYISFGAENATREVQITGITLFSDTTDNTKMPQMRLYFLNASDIDGGSGSVKADNVPFAPTYAEFYSKRIGQPVIIDDDHSMVGGPQVKTKTEICRKVKLDSTGKLYFAPTMLTAITPASAQKFTFVFYAFLL